MDPSLDADRREDRGAAVAIIRDYYDAIAEGDYARAYAHWSGQGAASGQTFDTFARGYAETAFVAVEPGEPGRVEGAAGSRYVDVPVVITATTRDGRSQCFGGAYTLVRGVVSGATREQQQWRIHAAAIAPCASPDRENRNTGSVAARAVVEGFGARFSRVSLLAPLDLVRNQIRTEYGEFVTAALLASWLADPATAPGRSVSSPWPDRIEVRTARRTGVGEYEVEGDVVYVTSTDRAELGGASRTPVIATVVRDADFRWKIAAYRER